MSGERFHLPSGVSVELDVGSQVELDGPFGPELDKLRLRLRSADGSHLPIERLPLADFQVFRGILRRIGRVPERELELVCSNCRAAWHTLPSSSLELGPFVDGELCDPELDRAFDFDREYSIPAVRADAVAAECSVRLAPRSVSEAAPLHRSLAEGRAQRVTSNVVRGLGIAALDGETDPKKIARLLRAAPVAAYDAVVALFEDAHYPPRLDVPHVCPGCGMSEWLSIPMSRELSLEPALGEPATVGDAGAAFMSIDEFEALVAEEAARLYAELRVREIDLAVLEGPAEVDDGGEPLLGSYQPPEPEALIPRPAEIRLFYRTFANIAGEEGPYDVRAEVNETLRHELEHHFGHLAGDDPLDDEERAEIHREHSRRVGRREVERRAARVFWTEARRFFARTWWVWVIAFAATVLVALAESR
ncbi:MAG: metallopeptidase family protein [Myxococcales bacterium]|nr:metallopeptidase family protein [Myxococcales bacterium]